MAHSRARRNPADGRAPVRRIASGFAVLLLLLGALGFVPGVTGDYADLRFAGPGSGARLFGVFQVSAVHNLVHLVLGVAGLVLARTVAGARTFLVGAGAVYLVLWLAGLAIDGRDAANVLAVNSADSWLHLLLGAAMLASGLVAARRGDRR
ncbi:DUF4383 domain-containing protein [Micromonospora tulbaghiae]|nr:MULTISPECIES: DUF4383 domain-containing protein [Micromonospora]KAB1908361.1 DUF4383 domain-containing protein [Micromonospora sp. AMSO1212t]MBO4140760.1 DUF4383 domain-containing protein [Micromonospora tulbaghiae]MDX5459694.1 DUF4383 domain-containing protein [Micromonospora tulbaghiae]